MARWLLLALASALCADAGRPPRYADYSGARMPQYDTLYDARAASVPADDYRDRADVAAPLDYNSYDQESNDKRNLKTLLDEDLYQMPLRKNSRKEPSNRAIDDTDADYNTLKNKKGNKRPKNVLGANEFIDRIPSKLSRSANKNQQRAQDDEDNEAPLEHIDEEKDSGSDGEKGKFVRRDIRQKVQRKSRNSKLRDPDYDDRSESRPGSYGKKIDGPLYADPELAQNAPNLEPEDVSAAERRRPPGYKTAAEDTDDSETASSQRHRAPMPKTRKQNSEYVDYNDMNRIEKIKNLPTQSTQARTGPPRRRWSFHDGFRRRYMTPARPDEEDYEQVLTTTQPNDTSAAPTPTTENSTITSDDDSAVPLSKDQIEKIRAFVNESKQLSLAEKSQLSILKKAQRRDSVKEEMLKDKPPVLLQVTQRMQTVVMVEPALSTQEPWLRARDIAEDSPERIARVKRFMRNKLVANARNISELMENWDDTVCDYVDISVLDENGAVWMHTRGSWMSLLQSVCCTLSAYSIFHLFWFDLMPHQ